MKENVPVQLTVTLLCCVALFLISGCGAGSANYKSDDGRAYYDQYVDRPGYYDFHRPVIFVPEDRSGVN